MTHERQITRLQLAIHTCHKVFFAYLKMSEKSGSAVSSTERCYNSKKYSKFCVHGELHCIVEKSLYRKHNCVVFAEDTIRVQLKVCSNVITHL